MLATASLESKRESDRSIHIRLRNGPDDLVRVADLASREKACCGFFEFSIEIGADSNWLVIEVPVDAVAALDGFAALVPPPG